MRNKWTFYLLITGLFAFTHRVETMHTHSNLSTVDSLSPVLIINTFDAMELKVRKNKRELFRDLTEYLKVCLSQYIKAHTKNEPLIIMQTIEAGNEAAIYSLMKEKHAKAAIAIRSLDVYFVSGSEKRDTDSDGDPIVITPYDLCGKNEYSIYGMASLIESPSVSNCKHFTERSARDKHFTIKLGPDIVAKKKHTFGVVETNAERFILGYKSLLGN